MAMDVHNPEFVASSEHQNSTKKSWTHSLHQIKQDIKEQKIFWISLSVFFAASYFSSLYFDDGIMDGITKYAMRFGNIINLLLPAVPAYLAILVISHFLFHKKNQENSELFASIIEMLKAHLPKSAFFFRILIAFISFSIFMGCFIYWKEKIGQFNTYDWDITFKNWDAVLFGGMQAWEFFHPYLGNQYITRQLDFLYTIWVPLCVVFWVLVYTSTKISQQEKHQYLCASLFSWIIIGIIAATIFASGGPVYYHEFTGDKEMYSALLNYLNSFTVLDEITGQRVSGLNATATFEYLWLVHIGSLDLPGGISAMPSMHNAQAILFAIITYKFSRIFGHLMVLYAIAIFIGSFHLAWHYAIDGIFAVIMVLPIWYLSGVVTGSYQQKNRLQIHKH